MSIKKNIIYNSILTLSQYLIGFITFPYISRVLGVANVGIVSFVDNTINYFVLFSTLGAATIGVREIAKYQNDKSKINIIFSSLITIYTLYTSIVIIAYLFAITFIDKLKIHQELFYIGLAKLFFSVFLIEWFYRGIENFKYITSRTIIIKIIYVLTLFIVIKSPNDYKIYFLLTTLTVVLNSFINLIYSRKFVKFSFGGITLKPYFKQSLFLGSFSILTSMYTTFNVMYLGFVTDSVQVGYYWAAITLYAVILGLFSAFTGAMMPRMSSIIHLEEKENFSKMIGKSFDFLLTLSFPIIVGSITLAPQIIKILSGPGYEGAVLPMQIIMSLTLVVGIAQILSSQILIPMQKDKLILFASIIGASIGLLANLLLVKQYGSIGTAIVLLTSEVSVTIYYIYIISKNQILVFPWKIFGYHFFYSLPYLAICYFTQLYLERPILILIIAALISSIYFLFINIYILKNIELLTILQKLKNKFN